MEISITVKGESLADLATKIVALGQNLNSIGAQDETPALDGLTKKKKAKAAAPVEEEPEFQEPELDEDGDEEPEETPKAKKKKSLSREDVIAALQKYAEENDRPAAIKILKKFKVKSIKDLDEKEFPKIMAELE